jgi:hypothetical protein
MSSWQNDCSTGQRASTVNQASKSAAKVDEDPGPKSGAEEHHWRPNYLELSPFHNAYFLV